MDLHPAVAIDGPAASGKSTVAKLIAQKLGYVFVNSGAMYRIVTCWMLHHKIDIHNSEAVIEALKTMPLICGIADGKSTLQISESEDFDYNAELSSDAVNQNVSVIATIPEVRAFLVSLQQNYQTQVPVVMEGRDIGTVVFPDTPFKYYIDASPEIRAARRAAQGLNDEISQRDKMDSSRKSSPLKIANEATIIDSSYLTIEEVVEKIVVDIQNRLRA